jgi:hypothetical protein
VTITITNTSLEFTKLGSFGNVYSFGQNLVNSMDTSFFLRSKGKANSPDLQVRAKQSMRRVCCVGCACHRVCCMLPVCKVHVLFWVCR